MPVAVCKFIKRLAEFQPQSSIDDVPPNTRGIYALLKKAGTHYEVVYIGLSAGLKQGVASRLRRHKEKKGADWSHFTVMEVHDNVSSAEICELEGLFRHIYRHDSRANRLNRQLKHRPFLRIRQNDLRKWA